MKKIFLYLFFTFVTALSAFSQSEQRCHYDVKADAAGDYIIAVLYNPSVSGWTNEIYVLSFNKNEHDHVIDPKASKSYPLKVDIIEGSPKIAAKKREYGITRR